ncbi:alkaline phosphatase [Pedobacter sp. UYP24]
MKRRDLFKGGTAAFIGSALLSPLETIASIGNEERYGKAGIAKNIIFLVSDGMSIGTLNMADLLLKRKEGRQSRWLSLYEQSIVKRALMDTASASSLITDSAAASSSWGGGKRVPNGSLNVNADGSENVPIWKKFKAVGKSAGCVTTVPITHATPAGFCVTSKLRSDQPEIALKYLTNEYDVLLGGGMEYFSANMRADKQDVFKKYADKGYQITTNRDALLEVGKDKKVPFLGVFYKDGLPYSLDRANDKMLQETVPTLAEMTQAAISNLNQNKEGFVLQVEAGKVDWAAHANDVGALLYDQIAFDEAVGIAMDFAQRDKNTLVIITTDHGNSNPGLFYGAKANANFDRIQQFKHTNEWVLAGVDKNTTSNALIEKIEFGQGYAIKQTEAIDILKHYDKLDDEALYNPRKLPFKQLALVQVGYTSVGWGAMDHSADYVELAMFGPGSELLLPFVKNTDLHYLMLKACGL